MKRALALTLMLILSACQEEEAKLPPPVAMTAQSIGYYCQMNVIEHGGPKGQIALEGFPGGVIFTSQVSDTVAYLRMPEQNYKILATYVTDMGTAPWDEPGKAQWILIDKAVFVVGSDQMGGMGQPEYVPFGDPAKAAEFAAAHGGRVVTLAEIPAATASGTAPAEAPDDTDYSTRLRNQTQKGGE